MKNKYLYTTMGCQKLDTDFCNFLEIAYSEKRGYGEKKCLNYYPFGLKHKGYNNVVVGNENPYKYNGKELNEELGLDWYDVSARNYDPALGRWMNLDPLGELMPKWSLYTYTFNNPISYNDPSGMIPEGSNKDGDCDPCDLGTLDEAIVTTKKSKKERKHMPAWMNIPLDYWYSPYDGGDIDDYNKEHGTNYTNDGRALHQWYYDNYYEQQYNDLISSIHSGTATAAKIMAAIAGGTFVVVYGGGAAISYFGSKAVYWYGAKVISDASLQYFLTGDIEMISAGASGFGGPGGAVLSIGASGVDYSYRKGYSSILSTQNKKSLSNVSADIIGIGVSKTLPFTASKGNALGDFGVETFSNAGGIFLSDNLK